MHKVRATFITLRRWKQLFPAFTTRIYGHLSIEYGFPSGTRLMGILHIHLKIYSPECTWHSQSKLGPELGAISLHFKTSVMTYVMQLLTGFRGVQSGNYSVNSPGYYLDEWPVCALNQVDACTWTSECQAPGQVLDSANPLLQYSITAWMNNHIMFVIAFMNILN